MKKHPLIKFTFLVIMFLPFVNSFAQQIKSYDLKVAVDVYTKKIQVNGQIIIDFEGKESISTVLWKNTKIAEVSSKKSKLDYVFETDKPTPVIYIDDGKEFVIYNRTGQKGNVLVKVSYKSDFTSMENSSESFTADWLQIGFYNAWFPVHLKSREATSKIELKINEGFKVSSSGLVTKKGGVWLINQPWGAYDNVIIASKDLKTERIVKDGNTVDLVYTELSDVDKATVLEISQEALKYFGTFYPKQDKAYLKFVVRYSNNGGGYNRSKFISLRFKKLNYSAKKTIAHEIAHFWATGANPTTWQDWLNESFAEYSALMFVKERLSEEVFDKFITQYKKTTLNLNGIWGALRESDKAYFIFYRKGALVLNDLNIKVGAKTFKKILNLKSQKKIVKTIDFLNLLEEVSGKETRNWFENKLKK